MKELAYFFCRESQQASAYILHTYMELAMLITFWTMSRHTLLYIYGTCKAYHFLDNVQAYIIVTPGVTTRWFSYDGEEDTPRELYCNKNLSDMIQN